MKNFNHINRFILRTPIKSVHQFSEIPTTSEETIEFVKDLFNDEVFKESIFLASPDLYYEWEKFVSKAELSVEKQYKLALSIVKYYIRSTTRCTPFGLFSGYTEIQHKQENKQAEPQRFTGLDLDFIYTLLHKLNQKDAVRSIVKFAPNSSIYKIGSNFRYAEYKIQRNKRAYTLVEVEADEVLELIYKITQKENQTLNELVELLMYSIEDISKEDVTAYINSLIDAQFLVSDLDISINGDSPFEQLIQYFENIIVGNTQNEELLHYYNLLTQLKNKLERLDAKVVGNSISEYEDIFSIAKQFNFAFDKKFLINSNLRNNLPVEQYDLTSQEISKIKKAVSTLSRFSIKQDNININEFKKAFYKRYEDKEVQLCVALDNEVGVGYLQDHADASNFSSLIDDIKLKGNESPETKLSYHKNIHKFWTNQLTTAKRNNTNLIDLSTIDLSDFPVNTDQLSDSFYTMINKYKEKISIEVVGGTGALNLVGRFSSLDNSLNDLFNEAQAKEQKEGDEILVELLHVPDNRSGNILLRNVNRTHEISFLTKGSENAKQIALDDIYISIKHNKIVLRSRSLNKRIKVVNTTAHNFQYNSLPIYQFLGELQMQDCNTYLGLNLGSVNYKTFTSRPRIAFDDIILAPAKWNFSIDELASCYENGELSTSKLRVFLKKHNVPRYVCLREQQDHTLWIDLENEFMYTFLLEAIKKKKQLVLEELLVDSMDSRDEVYNAEYIIPFFKEAKKSRKIKVQNITEKRTFIPGEEWLYFKLYTGTKTGAKLLQDVIHPLIHNLKENGLIEKWHFIRFRDPDFHLRLRFLVSDNNINHRKVVEKLNRAIHSYVSNHAIWKVEISTYNRELERYGNELIVPSESVFHRDSDLILEILNLTKNTSSDISWLPILKTIDNFYELHQYTLQEKSNHINELYEAFLREFNGDKNLKKQIESKFRKYKNDISLLIENSATKINEVVKKHNEKLYEDLGESNEEVIQNMKSNLTSYIHMHVNRFSITNPRMHELVFYGLLSKYYKMRLGKEKYVQPKALTI
ncbi:lantibiotic biosynthesis protein [Tenacibaculum sp. 190524A05c]|uniref:lantibiotic dehydratase n=1 Tax=Tenacibaculum platacis TaxID=3137852 RepID=UPI0031FB681D